MTLPLSDLEKVRFGRLEKIRQMGIDPYGLNENITNIRAIDNAISNFLLLEDITLKQDQNALVQVQEETVQGRIILLRDNGKLLWAQIRDDTNTIQVAISMKNVGDQGFALAKLFDLGDIILVRGPVRRTKTGEVTIWANYVSIACKSLAHPPDKRAGLQDIEARYRQRYLDMAFNNEFISVIKLRSQIISLIREEFHNEGFDEVETPMLHPIAGGAAARPFKTHLNALDIPLYLRVAPELYLKRLIIGGMPKVFEINRNFRNEGIDATHNPEFTALEAYAINDNVLSLMAFVENAIKNVAFKLNSTKRIFNGHEINFDQTFQVISYSDLYKRGTGKDLSDEKNILAANEIFEERCESLINPCVPTFIFGYPAAISPLTKRMVQDPNLSYRADLFIGGMEIGTIYSEQNDPEEQFRVFSEQVADDEEGTHRTMDFDFIEALKVGMPPTGGLGIGIDRLVMLLTEKTSVRDVIAFPFMKPRKEEHVV